MIDVVFFSVVDAEKKETLSWLNDFLFQSIPVSLSKKVHLFIRLEIYHHITFLSHAQCSDIQILAVCSMFVT